MLRWLLYILCTVCCHDEKQINTKVDTSAQKLPEYLHICTFLCTIAVMQRHVSRFIIKQKGIDHDTHSVALFF